MTMARRQPGWTTGQRVRSPVSLEYQRLWAAVLEGVAHDLAMPVPLFRTVSYGAPNPDRERDWLHAEGRDPGDFLWVCELLGVDPDYTRRMLLAPPEEA